MDDLKGDSEAEHDSSSEETRAQIPSMDVLKQRSLQKRKLESVDDDDDRKAEQRAANRRAASRFRERRKNHIEKLQRSVSNLNNDNMELRNRNSDLRIKLEKALQENRLLRSNQQLLTPVGTVSTESAAEDSRTFSHSAHIVPTNVNPVTLAALTGGANTMEVGAGTTLTQPVIQAALRIFQQLLGPQTTPDQISVTSNVQNAPPANVSASGQLRNQQCLLQLAGIIRPEPRLVNPYDMQLQYRLTHPNPPSIGQPQTMRRDAAVREALEASFSKSCDKSSGSNSRLP